MLQPPIEADEVTCELERLLDLPEFKRNRTASAFLKFVVDEELAGRGDRLKAFTIATLALQRDESFDPQHNSIVRVQATRVRQMLDSHYAGAGLAQPVHITLPRGSYVPVFARGPNCPLPAEGGSIAQSSRGTRAILGLSLCCVLVGAIFGILIDRYWLSRNRVLEASMPASLTTRATPVVQVVVGRRLEESEASDAFILSLVESIRSGLSAFDYLTVPNDEISGSQPDYILTVMQHGRNAGGENVALKLVHRQSGGILWASSYRGGLLEAAATTIGGITQSVVSEIGAGDGILAADWAQRRAVPGQLPSGHACVFSAFQFLRTLAPAGRWQVMSCLEQDNLANPEDPATMTMLAIMQLRGYTEIWPESRGAADLQRALQLAHHAYDLTPHRARSQFALFLARFYEEHYEDAFAIGARAVASNPYSADIRAHLGAAYVMRGRYAEGLELLQQAYAQDAALPGSFGAYVALGAFMTADRPQFARWAQRKALLESPIGLCVRLLALNASQDREGARAIWATLDQNHPGFVADPAAALTRSGFIPELRDLLANIVLESQDESRLAP